MDEDDHIRSRRHQDNGLTPPSTTVQHGNTAEESDPLEDLVGPLPPNANDGGLPSRGRGSYRTSANNMDAHFAADYDPNVDVELEEEGDSAGRSTIRPVAGLMGDNDDWELAHEALRDRARWRQKGQERLREAGFDESVVEKWKNNAAFTGAGAANKELKEVKWSKRGEGREWDRGKIIGEDGHVDLKASW